MVNAALRLITATIKVGTEDYTTHIQDFTYAPTTPTSEVTDVGGTVHRFAGEAGWNLTLNVFQDFTVTGFARKCLEEQGEQVEITIVDGPTTWTSTVTLVAPTIGGPTKQVGVSALQLPSSEPLPTTTPAS